MSTQARTSHSRAPGRVRIGCAGWAIGAPHRALFGAGDSVLARYATLFDCVEINSSFYRSHRRDTYARWARSVPEAFRFSVKLPRAITHEAGLRGCGAALDRFFDETAGLGTRLGCVLVQLPPSRAFDARVAATFLAMLRRRHAGAVALEPRHASWFQPAADALLRRHRIARVAADPAPAAGADRPGGHAAPRYWRWHGAPRVYYSAYDEATLARFAAAVAAEPRRTHWCIFDNTAHGHAIADALRLRELLSRRDGA